MNILQIRQVLYLAFCERVNELSHAELKHFMKYVTLDDSTLSELVEIVNDLNDAIEIDENVQLEYQEIARELYYVFSF